MYKLTHPDGYDFYSGTINYRENIGKVIRLTDYDPPEKGNCGKGLHSSRNPNDCLVGVKSLPVAAFQVKTIDVITRDKYKTRSKALKVIREVNPADIFEWNYNEACNPINPFNIDAPEVSDYELNLLKNWSKIYDLANDSVCDSITSSTWETAGMFVWNLIRDSIWTLVRRKIVSPFPIPDGFLIWDWVFSSARAYMGSLFPCIKKWKYIKHKRGEYPFQSAVDLWKSGLVPSFNGYRWKLYTGKDARVVWKEDLRNV